MDMNKFELCNILRSNIFLMKLSGLFFILTPKYADNEQQLQLPTNKRRKICTIANDSGNKSRRSANNREQKKSYSIL